MTVITAAHNGKHYAMACDTMHVTGYTKINTVQGNHKIIQVGENIFGFAGVVANRLAVACILREITSKHVLSCVEGIYILMLKVHELLRKDHFLTAQATHEEPFEDNDLSILICNPHGIFNVGRDRSAVKHDDYWALGSGMHYALGAMHSYTNDPDSATHLEEIATRGVEAACAYSDSCGGPIISKILKVERSDDGEKKENQGGEQ